MSQQDLYYCLRYCAHSTLLVKLHVGTNIVPLQAPKVWVYLCGKEDTGVQDSCSSRKSCPNLQSSIIIIIII